MKNGIELVGGNGYRRRCCPVLACFIMDYKEQFLLQVSKQAFNTWFAMFYQKNGVGNLVVRVADLLVNLKSAWLTMQQPGNSVE